MNSNDETESSSKSKLRLICIVLVALSFWSTWFWYAERMFDGSDEPLGILSAIALISLVFVKRKQGLGSSKSKLSLLAATLFYIAYILSFSAVSKLASATLATLAVCFTINSLVMPLSLAEITLALLSLPLVASINFYAGYPLRVIVAKLASLMLAFGGIMAKSEGALLNYGDQLVYVDAPCSGVKLLWFAIFVTAVLCSYLNFSNFRTSVYLSGAFLLSILANSLRVTSLFYLECDLIQVFYFSKEFLHQASGLIVEAILIAGIIFSVLKIKAKSIQMVESDKEINPNYLYVLSVLALIAMCLPTLPLKPSNQTAIANASIEFPKMINGKPLVEIPMVERQRKFLQNFPGEVKLFKNANKLYIVKLIEKPTRKVHPASDCYRGSGYSIEWKPIQVDKEGLRWSHFVANKGGVRVSVKEHIIDSNKNLWTDPSSWYWSATLGETKPPWWGITVEEGGLN